MNLQDVLKTADAISVRRVFGEPYEKDGLTVIPVASVAGGGGGAFLVTRPRVARATAQAAGRRPKR